MVPVVPRPADRVATGARRRRRRPCRPLAGHGVLRMISGPPGSGREVVPPIAPRAPWRVAAVEARPGYRLRVRFLDGTEGEVDLAQLIRSAEAGVFAALRDEQTFRMVRVELGVVTWPGDLDLAPDAMYRAIRKDGAWIVS